VSFNHTIFRMWYGNTSRWLEVERNPLIHSDFRDNYWYCHAAEFISEKGWPELR